MAQGRSTKIISMIKWIRTSRLSIKNSLSPDRFSAQQPEIRALLEEYLPPPPPPHILFAPFVFALASRIQPLYTCVPRPPHYRGTSLIRNRPPPLEPPMEPRHGPIVGSYGVAVSYKRGTPVLTYSRVFPLEQELAIGDGRDPAACCTEREFFIDNLMVRIHLIIVMILVDRPCAMGV